MIDELAWVFNIRGYDVAYNPVGVGFGYIGAKEAVLFALPEKVTPEVRASLTENGVRIEDYYQIDSFVRSLGDDVRLLVDTKRITYRLYDEIPAHCRKVLGVSAITQLKAIKNDTEISNLRTVMARDGVALTRFFKCSREALSEGRPTPSMS